MRYLLKMKYQVNTTFDLLSAIGGNTASDLKIVPDLGHSPSSYTLKPEINRLAGL